MELLLISILGILFLVTVSTVGAVELKMLKETTAKCILVTMFILVVGALICMLVQNVVLI